MLGSIRKLLALAAVLGALVPAGATAMVIRDAPEAATASVSSTTTAGHGADNAGFRWGDAGVGAAATLAVLAAGGVAVLTARRRARRRGFAAG